MTASTGDSSSKDVESEHVANDGRYAQSRTAAHRQTILLRRRSHWAYTDASMDYYRYVEEGEYNIGAVARMNTIGAEGIREVTCGSHEVGRYIPV